MAKTLARSKRASLPLEQVNDNNIEDVDEEGDEEEEKLLSFAEMGLDSKIMHAIASLNWSKPTLIQEKTIPLALEGKVLKSFPLLYMVLSHLSSFYF